MPSYKYFKSDFALLVSVSSRYTDSNGNSVGLTANTPFVFRMYSPLKGDVSDCYEASHIDGVLKNCVILSDREILVFVDHTQHEFKVGEFMLEAEWIIDDTHYEGDQENNIMRLYDTGILLTDKPDLDSEGVIDFVIDNGIDSSLLKDIINAAVNIRIPELLDAINNLPDAQSVILQVQTNTDDIADIRTQMANIRCKLVAQQVDDLSVIL